MRPSAFVSSPLPPTGRLVAVRALLALAAIGLCAAAAFEAGTWRAEQHRLTAYLADAAPLVLPERLEAEVARESDPARARLRTARGVFAAEFGRRPPDLPPGSPAAVADAAASASRLAAAAQLAAESFAERPAAWEAPLVIGGATYLARLRTEDDRLIRSYRDWEAPLLAARSLAPGRFEPEIVLAHAYARLWPVLSPEKRRFALGLIRRGLADPYARQDLLPAWLAVAGDRKLAFAPIPDDSDAWAAVRQIYSQRLDWQAMRDARVRYRRALTRRLAATLEDARQQVRRGNGDSGRALYFSLIARAGEAEDGEPLLTLAIDECPAGQADAATAASLAEALGWILDRCRFGMCPLGPAALARLARLTGEADPVAAALAAHLAGDRDLAESLERQAGQAFGAGFPARRSPASLAALSAEAWPTADWTVLKGRARRELVASRSARGFEVAVGEVTTGSAVVEVRLDGDFVGTFVATAGTPLDLPVSISPGLHLLEIASINGGPAVPGAVRLLVAPG
jgi:hypothetical protein